MERTPHVMMAGDRADAFFGSNDVALADPACFRFADPGFSEAPLPADLRPARCNEKLPAPASGFAGVWAGVLGASLNHVLVV